ncbi:hypothetical protein [Snodgrassella communis]|uniref:Uncharacterized protein n=1 Tax=Snodgrassella communis TaxID=2946699 RepID=A0A836MSN9_9NEIS|nr:hypothetical protein [Snodgrassella communis]KDN13484.1 hypothetical protein SALWKB12_0339 [Snodgrassella communis]KDN15780.1 hypothetical protein SALWKB29_0199 [Snodgrassella communis]
MGAVSELTGKRVTLGASSEIRLWKWVQADFVADIAVFLSSIYQRSA